MALTVEQYNNLHNALADLCEEAKTYLKTGNQYKATLILRAPHLPAGDVVISEDGYDLALKALGTGWGGAGAALETSA